MGQIAYFYCACAKRPYFYFLSKIWRQRRVPRPQFFIIRGNFGDAWTFKADIAFFIFALIFRTSGPKIAIFRGKIGEWVGRYWPQRTRSYFWGFTPLCQIWWKSTKKCGRESDDTHTDRQTQTDFIIFPMLYAIAMGQITNKTKKKVHRQTNTAMLCLRWWHHEWVSLMSDVCMKYCVLVAVVICHVITTTRYVITINTHLGTFNSSPLCMHLCRQPVVYHNYNDDRQPRNARLWLAPLLYT